MTLSWQLAWLLLAAILFALAFVLRLCAVNTGRFDPMLLGLFCLTCGIMTPAWSAADT